MIARPADNPFASRRIDRLSYRFRVADTAALIDGLLRNGNRGAIIGPHGSGKTTLLEHLAVRLEGEMVWIRLSADTVAPVRSARAGLPTDVGPRHTLLIDGAEQLGPWSWWRLSHQMRYAGAIVVTSHRPGRLPTIYECATDPELLTELVGELAPEVVDAVDLEDLFERNRGNIRECFRELYDLWAGRSRG